MAALLVAAVAACGDGEGESQAPGATATTSGIADTTTTVTAPPAAASPARITGIGALDLCSSVVHQLGATITDDRLTEISGLAFSRSDPETLYAHNDSGDTARLYATGPDGATVDTVTVDAIALDWEDMAAIEGRLFVGDIGDNLGIRPTVRVVEIDEATSAARSYTVAYPAGRPDAEALIVDPTGSVATIITKDLSGGPARIVEAALDPTADVIEGVEVGTMPVAGAVTAADLSADGAVIAVRTIDAIWLFDRAPDQSVAEALLHAPCPAPSVAEIQGESIALHVDGRGYTTVSEGLNPVRNDFRLPPGS